MKKLATISGAILVALGLKAEKAPAASKEIRPAIRVSQSDTTVPAPVKLKTTGLTVEQKTFKANTTVIKEVNPRDFKYYKAAGAKDSTETPQKAILNTPVQKKANTGNVAPVKKAGSLPYKGN